MLVSDFVARAKGFVSKTGRELVAVKIVRIWGDCIGVAAVFDQQPFYIPYSQFYRPIHGESFSITRPSQLFINDYLYVYVDEIKGKEASQLTALPIKRHSFGEFNRLYSS